jgi:hypothetical protein
MMNAGLIGVSWLRNVGFRRDSKPSNPMLIGIASLLIVQPLKGFAEAQGSVRPAMVDSVERMGLFDLAGRGEEDAEWLQATINTELRRDPSLSSRPVLPVVHAPVGTGVAMTVELEGEVPSEAARGAVVHIVQGTARKLRREVEIDDRLIIDRRVAAPAHGA